MTTKKKKNQNKITYSNVIVPKQAGLIIPRGPRLKLEWFVEVEHWILSAGNTHVWRDKRRTQTQTYLQAP